MNICAWSAQLKVEALPDILNALGVAAKNYYGQMLNQSAGTNARVNETPFIYVTSNGKCLGKIQLCMARFKGGNYGI